MRARIRVLEITASLAPGGAERMLVSLASALDRSSFEVGVVSLFEASTNGLESELEENRVAMWHLGKRPGPDLRMYSKLARLVTSFKPSVIHTHCYVTRYTCNLRAPVKVHTVHNLAPLETDRVGRLINCLMFSRGVVPVAVGEAVADSVRRVYGIPRPLCIPNGIDSQRFSHAGSGGEWRKANGFRDDDLLIVSVGRLEIQKNPRALASAVQELPGAHLLLVGDGKLRRSLEGYSRVHLLGLREDIPSILAASDIFALASSWEGLPLALVEAMSAGLPVVATSVGCVPEVVRDGVSGLLVTPGDHVGLVRALRHLIDHAAERRSMAKAAETRAELFSLRSMVDSYQTLFFELLGSAPAYPM